MLEKHKGLYQNRVTGSLAFILRPGNLATTVKWSLGQLDALGVTKNIPSPSFGIKTELFVKVVSISLFFELKGA